MAGICGVVPILGVGQVSSFPIFAVRRSCPNASHLSLKDVDESRYSSEIVKQVYREKISQRCCRVSVKCYLNKSRDQERKDVSQATLIWRAIKLPIYSVAAVPLTVASAAAYLQTGKFLVRRYLVLLISSIFIITWLNLSNDVYDFDTGADKNKKESVVNIVGSRTGTLVAANLLLAFGFAGLIWVASVAGNVRSLLLLLCAVICGYVYQCPPFRLSYQGLGEPLCFAAFGPFATTAFYLMQITSRNLSYSCSITGTILSASILVGCTTTLILFCSHFHQVEGDRAVGKFSPLVQIGKKAGSEIVKIAIVALYFALFVLSIGKALPLTSTVLCALTVPMGNMVVNYVEKNYHDNEKIFMAKYYCVRLHALFGIALAAGLVAARRFGIYSPRLIFP
ncbi:2-carboxy-1,4-naphthoquinone phytyltransferase, chloroplastic-like isoform X1 [Chenopodium quinoa]|uniref:2-carboxy-1,4-naphthoquinone phytyltransferase, chloroplastic-like isoform X1 n=1 Tax=Chenopodium quinoa TaxID=63459 RepID=UPI000B7994B3|nr:2-carboxy-1,4-naphthoquinone phytyltransferase, chloroplastic-like isoform X1 [Chenopodium quinoa]XP_021713545.1 2-carboxy-1,4-naphthoquinone phytyltransferase, chloroplastic-like isoform X1 [Chenopodium quinoa]